MTDPGVADNPTGPDTLAHLLRCRARDRADRPLLICDADRLTYAETERRSAELAHELIALGAGKGTHIGVLYPNSAEFAVAAFAAARIGAVVVPFSTFSTARELREQLVHSDIRILLAATGYRSHNYVQRLTEVLAETERDGAGRLFSVQVPQLRHVLTTVESDSQTTHPGPLFARRTDIAEHDDALLAAMEQDVDGSDPVSIVYTSGSTSAPKGVVHTHAALLGHQRNLNAIRELTEADVLFCNSPFFWIGGFAFGLLATLVAGATLVCSNATDPAATLDLLEREKPTVTNGFAAGIAHLARHPSFAARDLSSMRRGNLYPVMPAELRPRDSELRHNMLGMTEAGSVVLLSSDESDQPEHRRGSFGKPAPGFEVEIIDQDTGTPVAVDEIGELRFRGPYVMQGYYKRPHEDCFDPDGWFHTGDLARTDADGFVYFLGRSGAMIKTAGANVSPAEVEKAITDITGGAAYVFGLPHPDRGHVVAAVLTVEDPATFDESALREKLRNQLSAYKIPARIAAVRTADIPLMSSGKVDLRRLKKVFDD
ncbi:class I adenylate-forming enzyme family protein [Nocardia jiangxiensis]|uniref:Class I adenylate-forming enzyme family protein n=1 Tax=Nocardia jiangxiensis TaxID=282685 RepID=A0ABW6SC79_9NOCA|nr:class I adenylate-forming enzyme family protein [Nocardia jiangxiensis]